MARFTQPTPVGAPTPALLPPYQSTYLTHGLHGMPGWATTSYSYHLGMVWYGMVWPWSSPVRSTLDVIGPRSAHGLPSPFSLFNNNKNKENNTSNFATRESSCHSTDHRVSLAAFANKAFLLIPSSFDTIRSKITLPSTLCFWYQGM